jgi:hypothetical protein
MCLVIRIADVEYIIDESSEEEGTWIGDLIFEGFGVPLVNGSE